MKRLSALLLAIAACGPAAYQGGGYGPAPAPGDPTAPLDPNAPVYQAPIEQLTAVGSGQSLERVTDLADQEGYPQLSPDGSALSFTTWAWEVADDGNYTGNYAYSQIVSVAPSTAAARTVQSSNRAQAITATWSADGASLYYVSNLMGQWNLVRSKTANAGGAQMIGTVGVDGSGFTLIGEGALPKWSPDSQWLAFSRTSGDQSNVFIVDAATGGNLIQVTSDASWDTAPAWSPDGGWLVFSSNRGWDSYPGSTAADTRNLFAIAVDGTSLTQLTGGPRTADNPTWGSDGWIYFASNQAGSWDIWRIALAQE